MNELDIKIDELINILEKDKRLIDINLLKTKILSNNKLLEKIARLKELDKYISEYLLLKKELFLDEDFSSFKEKEAEIDFLILEINKRLNKLVNKGSCSHESN